MKNTILLAMLLLATVACNQKTSQSAARASEKPIMVELSITGMKCMGCVETVRSSIAQLEGVDTVNVSLEKANAVVIFKPEKTDTSSIRKAVELNGYKVTSARKLAVNE